MEEKGKRDGVERRGEWKERGKKDGVERRWGKRDGVEEKLVAKEVG